MGFSQDKNVVSGTDIITYSLDFVWAESADILGQNVYDIRGRRGSCLWVYAKKNKTKHKTKIIYNTKEKINKKNMYKTLQYDGLG